jgi:hypothetical protein
MTTQRLITQAEYIGFTDKLSEMIDVLFTALGDEDTPGSAASEAADFRDEVVAFVLPDEAKITADFIDQAIALVTALERESTIMSYCAAFNSAVISHLGQDVNTWLTSSGLRVHHLFRRGGNSSLSPVNVFPPVTIMGIFEVTGSGTGTWTEDPDTGAEVDTSMYADAQLEVMVINQSIGAASITVSITGTDFEGNAQGPHTAVIPDGSVVGTKVDVGTGDDRFATVTLVTITGGTSGDDLQVQTKEDRTL